MKFLLFFLLSLSEASMADVLFIDLNNVEQEINVARKAAELRGEKLIVLPKNRNQYINKEKDRLMAKFEQTHRKKEACYMKSDDCSKFNEELDALDKKITAIEAPSYDSTKLREELAQVKEKISSVIISGHDGEGSFGGDFGHIGGNEFLDILTNYHGRDNIRSLYLLGCNSATTHTLAAIWKKALPRALFIAGYEGTGYLRDNGLGHAFIKNVMAQEKNIVASTDMAEALKKFRSISPKDKNYNTAASLVLNCEMNNPLYLSSINAAESFTKIHQCSEKAKILLDDFLQCRLSETSPCPLTKPSPKIEQAITDSDLCQFSLSENLDEAAKIANQIAFLSYISETYSILYPSSLLRHFPPAILEELKIKPSELQTFPAIKKAILDLKRFYEKRFAFESIKNLKMDEMLLEESRKKHIDTAWLSYSNMDMSMAHKLAGYGAFSEDSTATTRAQAFHKALEAGENVGSYADRISTLMKEKEELSKKSDSYARFFDKEIALLKQYQSEKEKKTN